MLEPYDGKLSSTVLRGERGSNASDLPDNIGNITFTEKQSELYVGSMEELTLIPDIQIAEGTNTDALTYEWALTETPVTSSSSYNFEYEIISTDPQLNYIVERPVSTSPYTLLLTITDTVHDNLQYTKYWKIYVQALFLMDY